MDPNTYQVLDRGDTWAVAKESSSHSPFWVVCRYDWSDPDVVRWSIAESSYRGGGEGFARASPASGGGSRVHAKWENTGAAWTQKPLLFLIHVPPMRRVFRRMWQAALDEYADTDVVSRLRPWRGARARPAEEHGSADGLMTRTVPISLLR